MGNQVSISTVGGYMKNIDWNVASELGLIERINIEVLHPLGLAMTRNPNNGTSPYLLVAPDREFKYAPKIKTKPVLTKDGIHEAIQQIEEREKILNKLFDS